MTKPPIHVTLSEDRRKAKPWTWDAPLWPGNKRYTRKTDAKLGACRALGAWRVGKNWFANSGGKAYPVIFTTYKPKR